MKSVAVFGLGLIGGSLARDLVGAGWTVLGADADELSVRRARAEGIEAGPVEALIGRAADMDVAVLAAPVRRIPGLLALFAERSGSAVLTDVGSTKRSVVRAAGSLGLGGRFVGSHPLAGHHRSGWAASRRGLFEGARVWLCRGEGAPETAVERVAELWRAVGARPECIDADEHDRLLAWASHLPQTVSSALGAALAFRELTLDDLGPGGRSTTRLAASDPALWTDIALDNADELIPAVDAVRGRLEELRDALIAGEEGKVGRFFEEGRALGESGEGGEEES